MGIIIPFPRPPEQGEQSREEKIFDEVSRRFQSNLDNGGNPTACMNAAILSVCLLTTDCCMQACIVARLREFFFIKPP